MTNIFSNTTWGYNNKKKLLILVPCRDTVDTYFTMSLVELIKTTMLAGVEVNVIYDLSTILLSQRENLANNVIEADVDFALYLDSDMIFPDTTALRLMYHNLPVVCGNYMKRSTPLQTVAYKKVGDWNSWLPLDYSEDLIEVEGIGMGCFMFKPKILHNINRPFFQFEYFNKDWHGEDFYFQKKLRNAGYKIMVDMNLSTELRHVGRWAFGPNIETNKQKIKKIKHAKK